MVDIQRVGSYFFIIGALIAILSGAFPVTEGMQTIVLLALIITGAFVGLLNVDDEGELHFLIAAAVFIVSVAFLRGYLDQLELLASFTKMLDNLLLFAGTASLVVALKVIFQIGSAKEDRQSAAETEFDDPKLEASWNTVIFLSVCLAFVIFILEAFIVTQDLPFLNAFSWIIIAVFAVDAVILYGRSKGMNDFLRKHWIDVVSIIPFSGAFQLAKFVRLTRIVRVAGRTSKLARVSKLSHSSKFFSHHSGFNKYLTPHPKHDEKREKIVSRVTREDVKG